MEEAVGTSRLSSLDAAKPASSPFYQPVCRADFNDLVNHTPRPFRTLVFVDLEATGLRTSSAKVRIMEVSFVAIDVTDFIAIQKKSEASTRVLNKLTLCVNPVTVIPPLVSFLTGLDNLRLESQRVFDCHSGQMIVSFLGHLARPVCLVAHNGSQYDFPLLRAELERAGAFLDDDVVVVDSLNILKQIFQAGSQPREGSVDLADTTKTRLVPLSSTGAGTEDTALVSASQNDSSAEMLEDNLLLTTPIKELEEYYLTSTPPDLGPAKKRRLREEQVSLPSSPEALMEVSSLIESESTPERPLITLVSRPPPAPCRSGSGLHYDASDVDKVKKKLDFSKVGTEVNGRMQTASSAQPHDIRNGPDELSAATTPASFSLANLHKYLFGHMPKLSHSAEQDCISLMHVCSVSGKKFVELASKQAIAFQEVQKLW